MRRTATTRRRIIISLPPASTTRRYADGDAHAFGRAYLLDDLHRGAQSRHQGHNGQRDDVRHDLVVHDGGASATTADARSGRAGARRDVDLESVQYVLRRDPAHR